MKFCVLFLALLAAVADAYKFNLTFLNTITTLAENKDACDSALGFWETSEEKCFLGMEFAAIAAAGLLAVEHFNNRNGDYIEEFATLKADGCKLEFNPVMIDTRYTPDMAVSGLINQLGDAKSFRVNGIVGAATSASTMPTALISGAVDIPQISYSATSTQLDKPLYTRFSRTIPTDATVAQSICDLWVQLGFKNAAVVHASDGYGQAYADAIVDGCRKLGMENILTYHLVKGDKAEMKMEMGKVAEADINVILLVVNEGMLVDVVDAAMAQKDRDLFNSTMWMVSDGVTSADFKSLTDAGKIAMNGTSRVLATGGTKSNPRWQKFSRDWPTFDATAFDAYFTGPWRSTRQNVFKTVSPEISEVKNVASFMYDAVAAFAIGSCKLSGLNDELPYVNELSFGKDTFGTEFQKLIPHMKFSGLSGSVRFEPNGNRAESTANFELFNIVFDDAFELSSVSAGTFDEGSNWTLSKLLFTGGSSDVPSDVVIPVEDMKYSSFVRGFVFALPCINIAIAISFFIWTICHRAHLVVRAAQTPFLVTITIGVMISSSTIFFVVVDDRFDPQAQIDALTGNFNLGNIACMAAPWFYGTGFVLIFGPLFAKLWRIQRIFKNKNMQRIRIQTTTLFLMVLGMFMVEFVILLTWTLVDPVRFIRTVEEVDRYGNPTLSIGVCKGTGSDKIMMIIMAAYHFVILAILNYISYRTRKINLKFAESTYISLIMSSYVQILMVSVPVLVIVAKHPETNMFIRSAIVFLNDLSVLMFLFVPKIVAVHLNVVDTSGKGGQIFDQSSSRPTAPSNVNQSSTVRVKKKSKLFKKKNPAAVEDLTATGDAASSYLPTSYVPGGLFHPPSQFEPEDFEEHNATSEHPSQESV